MINLSIVIWPLLPTASSVCVCICLSVWNGSLRTRPHMRHCRDAFHHTWRWAALSYAFVWLLRRSQKRVPTALASIGFPLESTGACPSPSLGLYLVNFNYLLWRMHSFIKDLCSSTDCASGVMRGFFEGIYYSPEASGRCESLKPQCWGWAKSLLRSYVEYWISVFYKVAMLRMGQ